MKKIFTLCVVLCMSYLSMGATNLKHEFRATWLATVSGIDWPETKATNDATREQQKQELIDILDKMKAGNLNAVCFQVRSLCDAMYQSSYEPWSIALTGTRGKDPGYDPLQFAIDEAHKRGMELHVWVNPFRASTSTLAATDMLWDNAGDWLIKYNNSSFSGYLIDPGYPESRAYVVKVLMEIINNYDVDGLVMDDYFYAYGGTTNQDSVAQALHYRASEVIDVNNNGNKIDDWRRSNVDNVIKAMYDSIQVVKPWVRFGMGPGGIWTTDSKAASAYGISLPSGISGSDIYNVLYCNTVEWIKGGYVDYVNPQIYWSTQVAAQDYDVLCQWWSTSVCEHFSNQLPNQKRVHHFPSLATYKAIQKNDGTYYSGYSDGYVEIQRELDANRKNLSSGYTGAVFYNTTSYLQMSEELAESHFTHTALAPPMEWKVKGDLAAPTNLQLSGTTLSWQHATAERFTVYVYPKGIAWSTAKNDPAYLQGVIYGNSLDISGIDTNMNDIAVCAYDRFGVEHEVAIYSDESGTVTPPASGTITYELNGGMMNEFGWTSKNDMFQACMADCGVTTLPSLDEIKATGNDAALTTICTKLSDVSGMLNSNKWEWLEQYIMEVQNVQVGNVVGSSFVPAITTTSDAVYWRYALAAFFVDGQRTAWPYSADFSQAGKDEAYIPAWKQVYTYPTSVTSEFTLYDPYRKGYTFLGWYTNADFFGEKVTTINAETTGTLYAKWINNDWIITNTSTDGNIVTPNATDVFGANIVSNTYQDGQGVITFDGPVTSIGQYAFEGCKSLTSITIPNSVTSIGDWAFDGCSSLTSITIPNSVTSIGRSAFAGCSSLTSITIPNSVTSIGHYAFEYCSSLTSITIPNSVTSIGWSAFYGCSSLTSITIPNSVTSIETGAFAFCSGLKSMVVESGNTVYDSRGNCNAIIETATNTLIAGCQNTIIPNSVTSIGDEAFAYCRSLTSITIPNSVTSIGYDAFNGCSKLTSVTIPNSVTSIGSMAFYDCSSLTSITIPNSVTSIGNSAFYSCSSLKAVTCEATTPPTLGGSYVFTSSPTCYIPCGSKAAYEASDWAQYVGEFVEENCEGIEQITYTTMNDSVLAFNVESDFGADFVKNEYKNGKGVIYFNAPITKIAAAAFSSCSSLTSITLPEGVESIEMSAFRDCSSLTSITIPNSVTSIGSYAFWKCSSLTSITIPNSVTSIGISAFRGCSGLKSMVVESGNTVYDSRGNCNAIIETATNTLIAGCQNTIIPNSVTSIGDFAFYYCDALTSITIPNSVTSIGEYAFTDCSSLTSITIPNSVTSIGYDAFAYCSSLTSITIPNSVTSIGNGAFERCSSLTSITIPNSVTSIGKYTFYKCSSLTSITIPNSVTSIGSSAFRNCFSLTSITIPNSVTNIGDHAFRDCSSLTSITIPNSVTSIGEWAFRYCSSLTAITCEATTPPTLGDSGVFTSSPTCYIPCGSKAAYKASDWAQYVGEFVEEGCPVIQMCGDDLYWEYADGVLIITGTGDMYDYAADTDVPWYDVRGNIKTVILPDAMTKIGQNAFYRCTNLTTINMPASLIAIGEKAFAQDSKLIGALTLPATLAEIGERAFYNCIGVDRYTIQAMTPPVLGDDVFKYANENTGFYVSCEALDAYKAAVGWSSLNLRDACLNIYHYNTPLGANGVYTTEDTLVASIYYRRQFTPYRWETLYLPFEVDRVTVLENGLEYDLTAWDIVDGGHYFLAKPDGMLNKEILFGFTDELESHTPYIIQFSDAYYTDKLITFYGKESWNKLSTSFEVLSSSAWMQIAGNTTLQDQLLEKPVYMLRSGLDFILQKTTTTLHPFECYVMPYTAQSGAPARMNVRLRDDVATAVESVKGNESHLTYTVDGYTLTVYPQGQAFSIYSLNGALIYSCEAGKEAVDCELNSGCYLLHAGAEAHKIMM